jgi:hypothetical protein
MKHLNTVKPFNKTHFFLVSKMPSHEINSLLKHVISAINSEITAA